MRRPLIALTCTTGVTDDPSPLEQDRLNHAYSAAVVAAGGMPAMLPNLPALLADREWTIRFDGLLLTGGRDVDPARYGEPVATATLELDPRRDDAELAAIPAALAAGLPVLAICRGIQVLNVALGGTLIQDLPEQAPSQVWHRQQAPRHEATHEIVMMRGSKLEAACGPSPIAVNSFHHQAVRELGEGLRVTARASDGVVEALELDGAGWVVGVQYHPEHLVGHEVHALRLFEAFVQVASDRSDQRGRGVIR